MAQLHFAVTADSVTLWWELPGELPPRSLWQVRMNGQQLAVIEKTHYTVEGLVPEQTCSFEVTSGSCAFRGQAVTAPARRRIDVTEAPYRAVGDGQTVNTAVLQRAIDACGPNDELWLPRGVYLTGALFLHSHMSVYLEEGAVLQGTTEPDDYLPRIRNRFEGIEQETYAALLNLGRMDRNGGVACEDVLIHGHGTIAGGGRPLAEECIRRETVRLKPVLEALGDRIGEFEKPETLPARTRPRHILMMNCRSIRLTGLTIMNGPCWNVHMIYSIDILTDHCTVISSGIWNGDGWDPDSSEDCTLFACRFRTGDDAVAIKSGKNPEGNLIGRPTRRVRIFDCVIESGHGFAIGSEMSGGVEDVRIWDCDLSDSRYGLEIKATRKRGGYVRDVHVRGCSMPRIMAHSVGYNDDGEGAKEAPFFSDIELRDLRLTGI